MTLLGLWVFLVGVNFIVLGLGGPMSLVGVNSIGLGPQVRGPGGVRLGLCLPCFYPVVWWLWG